MGKAVIVFLGSVIFCLVVEILTLFMHCSLDLTEHLFMAILNSLSDKALMYSLKSVSGVYLVLLFGTYSFVSSFSLNLGVDFCALDKTATPLPVLRE